ncbi:hypothetical protein C492_21120 [Natronococcus jeotgali DSM 18795]|uniref:Uncharacterized protein n=1 Tax=Natronococcus jeotgali DSM 18795 TaxID=1227498 RepID=L9WNY6_9EURY|nr:hypothetical protein C492_21120 [Natronococcus jeotgali DSM 18795]
MNKEADTIIRDVFEIENQGTQTVVIGITGIPDGMSFYADEDDGAVPPSEGTSLNQDSYGAGSEHLPQIGAGGSLDRVGVAFYGKNNDLSDLADHDNPITINAYTEDEAGELS